jgi:hypothetical protein
MIVTVPGWPATFGRSITTCAAAIATFPGHRPA